jgi:hypothetical protein
MVPRSRVDIFMKNDCHVDARSKIEQESECLIVANELGMQDSAQIAFTLVPKQLHRSRAGLLPPLRTFEILRRNDCSVVLLIYS